MAPDKAHAWAAIAQSRFLRFIVSGVVNTAITYVIYLFLLSVMPYQAGYTISYLIGILLAFALNRYFVFKQHRGARSIVLFPLVYIVQYLCGMLLLFIWVEALNLSVKLAPLVVVMITIPVTYLLSRYIFLNEQKK